MGFPITVWRDQPFYDWVVVGQITDPTDILGNTRFIDGNFDGTVAWDIGAYEFRPNLAPTTCGFGPKSIPSSWGLRA